MYILTQNQSGMDCGLPNRTKVLLLLPCVLFYEQTYRLGLL